MNSLDNSLIHKSLFSRTHVLFITMIFIKALVSILLFAINVCGKDCYPRNKDCEPS